MAGPGKRGRKLKDLTGRVFGSLVVRSRAEGKRHGQTLWECSCVCGAVVVRTYSYLSGPTCAGHCGCLKGRQPKAPRPEGRRQPPGHSGFKALYSGYRIRAANKGLDFALSEAEFRDLTQQNCFFCKATPRAVFTNGQGLDPNAYTAYVYNGIDRWDNSLGYVAGNCVPCCKVCNYAKAGLSGEEFVAWAISVAEHITGVVFEKK